MIKEVRLLRIGKDGRIHYIDKDKMDSIFRIADIVAVSLEILVGVGIFFYVFSYMM